MAIISKDPPCLPADIEAEILLRLPVKTLKRFQCASKSWYSLISSSQFQKNHFGRAQYNPPLILSARVHKKKFLRFRTFNKEGTLLKMFTHKVADSEFDGMQSCLGLVCIGGKFVCSPSTEELISLPPTGYISSFGFGYSDSTQEFKVAIFLYPSSCEVFTLGTGHWRRVTPPPYYVRSRDVPFLHGAFHLVPIIHYGVQNTDYIAVFDIETEDYKEGIPLPQCYHRSGRYEGPGSGLGDFVRLTKLGGLLCLIFDFWRSKERLELWLLKDYRNGEWVKAYNINISSLGISASSWYPLYSADNRSGGNIILNFYDAWTKKTVRYDFKDETFTLKIARAHATYYDESFFPLGASCSTTGNSGPVHQLVVPISSVLPGPNPLLDMSNLM